MPQFLLGSYIVLGLLALAWVLLRGTLSWWRAREATIEAAASSPDDPAVVVTLVHGTWGRHTDWIRPSSPLCQSLLALTPGRVMLAPFGWSGRNSSRARTTAGVCLREHLASLIARYPAAAHFVVAHSHGGNIAMYAASDERVRTELAGIACLSTPFIHARRRRLGPISGSHMFAALVVGLWVAVGTLLQRFGMNEDPAIATGLGTAVLGAWLLSRLSRSSSDRMLQSIRLPNEPQTETLIIRAMGDEASGALTATTFLSFLISVCWTRPARLIGEVTTVIGTWGQHARRLARLAIPAVVAGGSFLILDSAYGPLLGAPLAQTATLVAAGLAIAGIVILAVWWLGAGAGVQGWFLGFAFAGLMLIPFVALLLIAVLPFGLDFVLVAPHLEVSAEATPPGAWNVLYLPLEHSDAGGSRAIGPLMHSSYHDPRAVRILSDWMKAIACTSPPAHPRPARGPASLR